MKCLLMTADVRTCNPQLLPDIYRLFQVTRKRPIYINTTFLGVNLRPWSPQNLKQIQMDSKYSKNTPIKGITLFLYK